MNIARQTTTLPMAL